MRLAREPGRVCAPTTKEAIITQHAVIMKRFTFPPGKLSVKSTDIHATNALHAESNNRRVQLVVVSKHTLGRVIQESVRIFPGSRQPVQNAAFQHFLGTLPLQSALPHAAS